MCFHSTISALTLAITTGHGASGSFDKVIDLPGIAGESTHFVASVLMVIVKWLLTFLGLQSNQAVVAVLYASLAMVLAYFIGAFVKWAVLKVVKKVSDHTNNRLIIDMRKANFFSKCSRLIPPLVMVALLQFAFTSSNTIIRWLFNALSIYICFVAAIALNALILVIWIRIDERENKKRLPLKGIVQLIKGVVWIMTAIVIICIIFDKSPATLLAGLGAFAAVLMLVFKDSILGVVAGVQLAENDMLRVGDWIVVDGTKANGNVVEVTLTSVKVLNWDKTITTLPPYSLVSGSFTNYRTMSQSGTRRIMRVYLIDADSVVALSPSDLNRIKEEVPQMSSYIEAKQAQAAEGTTRNVANPDKLADGTIETNLGLMRAYTKIYLDSNPHISHNDFCFVKTCEQTPSGIPLQIYCFTNTSVWTEYEAIQSEIFEHIAVMLPKFKLYIFENPTGRDTVNEGYLEANNDPAKIYGLPFPFMTDLPSK